VWHERVHKTKCKASHYRGQIIIIIVVTRTPKFISPFSTLKSNTTTMILPIYMSIFKTTWSINSKILRNSQILHIFRRILTLGCVLNQLKWTENFPEHMSLKYFGIIAPFILTYEEFDIFLNNFRPNFGLYIWIPTRPLCLFRLLLYNLLEASCGE
jgi:hypothetical protein